MTPQDSYQAPEYRLFSIEEANNLLPELELGFLEIRVLKDEVEQIVEEKKRLSKGNGSIKMNADKIPVELEILTDKLEIISDMIGKLQNLGVIIKDIDLGLVDFPHKRDNRTVYLCWQSGEEKIGYWHELDSGKTGRKPL